MIITVFSQKGEQSKSTSAVNLMAALMQSGRFDEGLLVDLDVQQSDATKFAPSLESLGVTVAGRVPARDAEKRLTVIDTPPTVNDATMAALWASGWVVVPCTPYQLSLEALARTYDTLDEARAKNSVLQARLVFTRVDRTQFTAGMIAAASALSAWPVCSSTIPHRKADFERAVANRVPVVIGAPKSAGAVAYQALAKELLNV